MTVPSIDDRRYWDCLESLACYIKISTDSHDLLQPGNPRPTFLPTQVGLGITQTVHCEVIHVSLCTVQCVIATSILVNLANLGISPPYCSKSIICYYKKSFNKQCSFYLWDFEWWQCQVSTIDDIGTVLRVCHHITKLCFLCPFSPIFRDSEIFFLVFYFPLQVHEQHARYILNWGVSQIVQKKSIHNL